MNTEKLRQEILIEYRKNHNMMGYSEELVNLTISKTAKEIFDDIEKLFETQTGCTNPFCQGYPDKEYLWIELKQKYGIE